MKKKWPLWKREDVFISNHEAMAFLFFEIIYISFLLIAFVAAIIYSLWNELYIHLSKNLFYYSWAVAFIIIGIYTVMRIKKEGAISIGKKYFAYVTGPATIFQAINYFLVTFIFWIFRCLSQGRK
jgi:hypothetical protein